MWIVQLALRRPYTFIVAALSVLIVSLLVILRTPTDIFPNINIPIVSIVWQHTEAIGRRIKRTSRGQCLHAFAAAFQNSPSASAKAFPALRPKR
jgi:hypothetical protein